jgi:uncharacterized phage-associated protein
MFNERKAAQVATWFLRQSGGSMAHLKLIKLMYLAERSAMDKHGMLITGDRFVSMDQGPVPSLTLSYLNGEKRNGADGWDKWISDKANHQVALQPLGQTEPLDELSEAEVEILSGVWTKFGDMGKWELVDYLHDANNCPEWKDPEGSSSPITYRQMFEGLGRSEEESELLAARIEDQHQIDKLLAAL